MPNGVLELSVRFDVFNFVFKPPIFLVLARLVSDNIYFRYTHCHLIHIDRALHYLYLANLGSILRIFMLVYILDILTFVANTTDRKVQTLPNAVDSEENYS